MPNVRQRPMQRPLNFVTSIPRSGARNVSLRPLIRLFFDKNVVSNNVWTNNKSQIELFRGTISIPIRVSRIPDTVDFSRRREIFVRPRFNLRPNTTYKLVIKKNLTSKAGEKLGKQVVITFTTRRRRIPEE